MVENKAAILRRKQVEARTGLARSTIYKWIIEGRFPKPISLGGSRAVGFLEADIDKWLCAQVDRSHNAR